jgi:hypothetical protein
MLVYVGYDDNFGIVEELDSLKDGDDSSKHIKVITIYKILFIYIIFIEIVK